MNKRPYASLKWIALACLLLLLMVASAIVAGRMADRRTLAHLSKQTMTQLQVRALALQRLIDRYRVLPTLLALDPQLRHALMAPADAVDTQALNRKLEQANGATHVSTLTLINREGRAIAASNWREPSSNVGLDYAFRPYFQRAMRNDVGSFYAIGISTKVPGYFIAKAVHAPDGQRIGVVVVKITLQTLEKEWADAGAPILLSDRHGVVFLSNRSAWTYHTLHALAPATATRIANTRQYGGQPLQRLDFSVEQSLPDGAQRVRFHHPRLPHDVIWRSQTLPAQGWTIHLLGDARPATVAARWTALLAFCAWLPLIVLGLFLQQRIRLADVRQRSREDLERLVAHYASALRSEQDSLVQAAQRAAAGDPGRLEDLPQGVSVVDAQLRLVAWNQRYARIFGFPAHLLGVGRPIEDLFRYNARRGLLGPGNVEQAIQRRLDYLRRGGPHMYERERPDGSVLEIRGHPLPDGGFVTSYADITPYKKAARALRTLTSTLERRVEKSTRELRIAKAQAERANRNKTRYVAAAVHDLLQPLNAARLFSGALHRRLHGEAEQATLERVDHALQALDSQLISMLDLARLESGALRPNITDFSLSPLLGALARQFGIVAQARGLELKQVDTRAWVRSDAVLLRRVLQNFLSNALHYTPHGRVLLGCRRDGDGLRIEVWDTGIGIPDDKRRSIFREFTRLDTGMDSDERSAGLGLSIVERIAATLGHPLRLRSWPGRGSVFSIRVPRATTTVPHTDTQPPHEDDSPLSGRRICYVGAAGATRQTLETLLHAWSCRVEVIDSLDPARGPETSPVDLVVLAYEVYQREKNDLSAALRRNGLPTAAIIITDAPDTPAIQAQLRAAGLHVTAHPLSPSRLRALMTRLLMTTAAAQVDG